MMSLMKPASPFRRGERSTSSADRIERTLNRNRIRTARPGWTPKPAVSVIHPFRFLSDLGFEFYDFHDTSNVMAQRAYGSGQKAKKSFFNLSALRLKPVYMNNELTESL